ncbi:MAG: hypothetical protein M1820_001387 [Bogoriella megaspora]|nr:MAG: hypothetical protein M1820_001387 [Bogoriella megaspora]
MNIEKPDVALLATCRELGIATVAYSPLGRGIPTGQYKSPDDFGEGDFRETIPRFSTQENFNKNLELVNTLQEMIHQGDIFPIPGTKKIKYLEENCGANNMKLTDKEEKIIRDAINKADVVGSRVAAHLMGDLIVDTPPLNE